MLLTTPDYVPVTMRGLQVHPENPLLFDFIIDTGHSGLKISSPDFQAESQKLIKYFLAALTIREKDLWVNLSPYEKDRILTDELGATELGRDMLAQDYVLKQLTASMIYPEKELGKAFWDKVYAQARQQFGTTDIPVDTFNKVWIKADRAKVLERNQAGYVIGAHLKVMLESDYFAAEQAQGAESKGQEAGASQELAKQVVREVVLPAIEKEVNEGRNFANLRQIFYAMILAAWYKTALKDAFLNQIYADQGKVGGIENDDPTMKEKIYAQYLEAYKKGVFNYIKEEPDAMTGDMVPRKYFSGGLNVFPHDIQRAMALAPYETMPGVGDSAMVSAQMGAAQAPVQAAADVARMRILVSDVFSRDPKFKSIREAFPRAVFEVQPLAMVEAVLEAGDGPYDAVLDGSSSDQKRYGLRGKVITAQMIDDAGFEDAEEIFKDLVQWGILKQDPGFDFQGQIVFKDPALNAFEERAELTRILSEHVESFAELDAFLNSRRMAVPVFSAHVDLGLIVQKLEAVQKRAEAAMTVTINLFGAENISAAQTRDLTAKLLEDIENARGKTKVVPGQRDFSLFLTGFRAMADKGPDDPRRKEAVTALTHALPFLIKEGNWLLHKPFYTRAGALHWDIPESLQGYDYFKTLTILEMALRKEHMKAVVAIARETDRQAALKARKEGRRFWKTTPRTEPSLAGSLERAMAIKPFSMDSAVRQVLGLYRRDATSRQDVGEGIVRGILQAYLTHYSGASVLVGQGEMDRSTASIKLSELLGISFWEGGKILDWLEDASNGVEYPLEPNVWRASSHVVWSELWGLEPIRKEDFPKKYDLGEDVFDRLVRAGLLVDAGPAQAYPVVSFKERTLRSALRQSFYDWQADRISKFLIPAVTVGRERKRNSAVSLLLSYDAALVDNPIVAVEHLQGGDVWWRGHGSIREGSAKRFGDLFWLWSRFHLSLADLVSLVKGKSELSDVKLGHPYIHENGKPLTDLERDHLAIAVHAIKRRWELERQLLKREELFANFSGKKNWKDPEFVKLRRDIGGIRRQIHSWGHMVRESAMALGKFSPDRAKLRGKEILVVEDEIQVLSLYQILLKSQGVIVHAAQNGQEALERLEALRKENGQDWLPDVVMTDRNMAPDMNGEELVQILRHDHPYLPVVMVTGGYTRQQLDIMGAESGGFVTLGKPAASAEIFSALASAIPDASSPQHNEFPLDRAVDQISATARFKVDDIDKKKIRDVVAQYLAHYSRKSSGPVAAGEVSRSSVALKIADLLGLRSWEAEQVLDWLEDFFNGIDYPLEPAVWRVSDDVVWSALFRVPSITRKDFTDRGFAEDVFDRLVHAKILVEESSVAAYPSLEDAAEHSLAVKLSAVFPAQTPEEVETRKRLERFVWSAIERGRERKSLASVSQLPSFDRRFDNPRIATEYLQGSDYWWKEQADTRSGSNKRFADQLWLWARFDLDQSSLQSLVDENYTLREVKRGAAYFHQNGTQLTMLEMDQFSAAVHAIRKRWEIERELSGKQELFKDYSTKKSWDDPDFVKLRHEIGGLRRAAYQAGQKMREAAMETSPTRLVVDENHLRTVLGTVIRGIQSRGYARTPRQAWGALWTAAQLLRRDTQEQKETAREPQPDDDEGGLDPYAIREVVTVDRLREEMGPISKLARAAAADLRLGYGEMPTSHGRRRIQIRYRPYLKAILGKEAVARGRDAMRDRLDQWLALAAQMAQQMEAENRVRVQVSAEDAKVVGRPAVMDLGYSGLRLQNDWVIYFNNWGTGRATLDVRKFDKPLFPPIEITQGHEAIMEEIRNGDSRKLLARLNIDVVESAMMLDQPVVRRITTGNRLALGSLFAILGNTKAGTRRSHYAKGWTFGMPEFGLEVFLTESSDVAGQFMKSPQLGELVTWIRENAARLKAAEGDPERQAADEELVRRTEAIVRSVGPKPWKDLGVRAQTDPVRRGEVLALEWHIRQSENQALNLPHDFKVMLRLEPYSVGRESAVADILVQALRQNAGPQEYQGSVRLLLKEGILTGWDSLDVRDGSVDARADRRTPLLWLLGRPGEESQGLLFQKLEELKGADFRHAEPAMLDAAKTEAVKARLAGKVIVMVDDHPMMRALYQDLFGMLGEVEVFSNPFDAMDFMKSRPETIGAVVTDRNMPREKPSLPRMDGDEFVGRLKADYPQVPVMMLTNSDQYVIDGLRESLAVSVLDKALNIDDLLDGFMNMILPGERAMNQKVGAPLRGGIDLNAQTMSFDIEKQGKGVQMALDPVLIQQFESGNFSGISPVILQIIPISGPQAILGLGAEKDAPQASSAS